MDEKILYETLGVLCLKDTDPGFLKDNAYQGRYNAKNTSALEYELFVSGEWHKITEAMRGNFKLTTGVKLNNSKLKWHLLPVRELEQIIARLTYGSNKYGNDNWKHVPETDVILDALYRHIAAWRKGEVYDTEKGAESTTHLAAAITNILFLMYFDNETELEAQRQLELDAAKSTETEFNLKQTMKK